MNNFGRQEQKELGGKEIKLSVKYGMIQLFLKKKKIIDKYYKLDKNFNLDQELNPGLSRIMCKPLNHPDSSIRTV